ncbi:MAG: hypothetical protein ACO3LZ_09810, partial [Candidatus Nanopelagicales bacterium]
MSDGHARTLDEFRELARDRRVVPVSRTLLADGMTAIGLFETLCADRAGTFLLESAEAGRSWSRYSFIGVRSVAMLTERQGRAHWVGRVPVGLPVEGTAWDVLRESVKVLHTPQAALESGPRFSSGFVGALAYDVVRRFENLPDENSPAIDVPEVAFLLATDLAVLDHFRGSVTLIATAINFDASAERVDEAWHDANTRLDVMEECLASTARIAVSRMSNAQGGDIRAEMPDTDYRANVDRAKEYIRAGDAFQVVLSQRFSARSSVPSPPWQSTRSGRSWTMWKPWRPATAMVGSSPARRPACLPASWPSASSSRPRPVVVPLASSSSTAARAV